MTFENKDYNEVEDDIFWWDLFDIMDRSIETENDKSEEYKKQVTGSYLHLI